MFRTTVTCYIILHKNPDYFKDVDPSKNRENDKLEFRQFSCINHLPNWVVLSNDIPSYFLVFSGHTVGDDVSAVMLLYGVISNVIRMCNMVQVYYSGLCQNYQHL